eukprot:370334-Karenia_brevis.AAC.1
MLVELDKYLHLRGVYASSCTCVSWHMFFRYVLYQRQWCLATFSAYYEQIRMCIAVVEEVDLPTVADEFEDSETESD